MYNTFYVCEGRDELCRARTNCRGCLFVSKVFFVVVDVFPYCLGHLLAALTANSWRQLYIPYLIRYSLNIPYFANDISTGRPCA